MPPKRTPVSVCNWDKGTGGGMKAEHGNENFPFVSSVS